MVYRFFYPKIILFLSSADILFLSYFYPFPRKTAKRRQFHGKTMVIRGKVKEN